MFIKHNDVYITENINNLSIKDLNIGDKVVLLETKKEEYSEKKIQLLTWF